MDHMAGSGLSMLDARDSLILSTSASDWAAEGTEGSVVSTDLWWYSKKRIKTKDTDDVHLLLLPSILLHRATVTRPLLNPVGLVSQHSSLTEQSSPYYRHHHHHHNMRQK